MTNITEKDLWIEMSIREISTQAHFADLAFKNIAAGVKLGSTDTVFSSIHSFLLHCANVSKMLKASDQATTNLTTLNSPVIIEKILNIPDSSIIHKRKFRNHLEHYDERLKSWIKRKGVNVHIGTYNIGPKLMIQIPKMIFVTHYDPVDMTFTFVDEDLNLDEINKEVVSVKLLADNWVNKVQSGAIKPPFSQNKLQN